MKQSWPRVPIKEVYLGLFDGPHATPPVSDAGPVFLGIGNVTEDGHIDLAGVRHISEADFPAWTKRVTPSPGDIVFTYEATLNRYAIVPEGFRGCLGRRMALIRPNPAKVDTRFLHYTFFGPEWRATIEENRLAGATVDRIPLTKFPTFPIRLPPLPTQRKIAAILSAYDDLIENNTRRVRVLEEMARALYREWFVEFRFPGHEGAEFVEDEQGRRPKGWERLAFSELFESTLGGDWGSDEPSGKDTCPVRVVRGTDFEDLFYGNAIRAPLRFIDERSRHRRSLQPHDIILENSINAKTRSAGTPFFVDRPTLKILGEEAIAASFCKVYRPKVGYQHLAPLAYLYLDHLVLTKQMEYFQNVAANGIANLQSKKLVEEGVICIPPRPLLDHALSIFADVLSRTLAHRVHNLRRTRDLLLPRLVSGELDVSALNVRGPGLEAEEVGEREEAVA